MFNFPGVSNYVKGIATALSSVNLTKIVLQSDNNIQREAKSLEANVTVSDIVPPTTTTTTTPTVPTTLNFDLVPSMQRTLHPSFSDRQPKQVTTSELIVKIEAFPVDDEVFDKNVYGTVSPVSAPETVEEGEGAKLKLPAHQDVTPEVVMGTEVMVHFTPEVENNESYKVVSNGNEAEATISTTTQDTATTTMLPSEEVQEIKDSIEQFFKNNIAFLPTTTETPKISPSETLVTTSKLMEDNSLTIDTSVTTSKPVEVEIVSNEVSVISSKPVKVEAVATDASITTSKPFEVEVASSEASVTTLKPMEVGDHYEKNIEVNSFEIEKYTTTRPIKFEDTVGEVNTLKPVDVHNEAIEIVSGQPVYNVVDDVAVTSEPEIITDQWNASPGLVSAEISAAPITTPPPELIPVWPQWSSTTPSTIENITDSASIQPEDYTQTVKAQLDVEEPIAPANNNNRDNFVRELLNLRHRHEGNIVRHDQPPTNNKVITTTMPSMLPTTTTTTITPPAPIFTTQGNAKVIATTSTTTVTAPTPSIVDFGAVTPLPAPPTEIEVLNEGKEPTYFVFVLTDHQMKEKLKTILSSPSTTKVITPTSTTTIGNSLVNSKKNKKVYFDPYNSNLANHNLLGTDGASNNKINMAPAFDGDFLSSFQHYYSNPAIFEDQVQQIRQFQGNNNNIVKHDEPLEKPGEQFQVHNDLQG